MADGGEKPYVTAGFVVNEPAAGSRGSQPYKKRRGGQRPLHAAGSKAHIWVDGRLRKNGEEINLQTVTENLRARTEIGLDNSMDAASRAAGDAPRASRFSASSRAQLLHYGDKAVDDVGRVVIGADGIYNDGEYVANIGGREKATAVKAFRTQQALDRIRAFAREHGPYFISLLQRNIKIAQGSCLRTDFSEFVDLMHLGLPHAQKAALLSYYYKPAKSLVDSAQFVEDLGGDTFLRECRKTSQKLDHKHGVLEAPEHKPEKDDYQDEDGAPWRVKIVCAAGFLVCPLWCIAWVWINSKNSQSRRYARISVGLSILFVVGIIAGLGLYFDQKSKKSSMEHCPQFQAVVLRLRLSGASANLDTMAGTSRLNYETQFNLKRALHNLYLRYAIDAGRNVEETILIDNMFEVSQQVACVSVSAVLCSCPVDGGHRLGTHCGGN